MIDRSGEGGGKLSPVGVCAGAFVFVLFCGRGRAGTGSRGFRTRNKPHIFLDLSGNDKSQKNLKNHMELR